MPVASTLELGGILLIDFGLCRLLESASKYRENRDKLNGAKNLQLVFPLMSVSNHHANRRGLEYDTRVVLRDDYVLIFLFRHCIVANGEPLWHGQEVVG